MRKKNSNLKLCMMGAKQAGIVSFLSVLSKGHKVLAAVSYSKEFASILECFNIPIYSSIKDKGFLAVLKKVDVLLSVHGREIVPLSLLNSIPWAINIHPYLYKYKGANPVERALKEKNFRASVGAHLMEEEVDRGEVLIEEFVEIEEASSCEEIYNQLYPYYCIVTLKVLEITEKSKRKVKR
jgi:methionyl-tRNA formyltransferase